MSSELFRFYLSRGQDENQKDAQQQPVFVRGDLVRELKPYHFDSLYFLYTCYKNKLGGAVLNQSDGMNFPMQIAAFFSALKLVLSDGLILVLADNSTLGCWYYHLTKHSEWNVKLDIDYSEEEPCIILLCHSDEEKIKMLQNYNFSMVIVDDFDKVAKKVTIKKLTAHFRVGLTLRNFVKYPDQKLQWAMLRWTNPKHFGTFDSFCEKDNEYLESFTEPFVDFWQRRTWIFYDDVERETEVEVQEYTETVQKWLSEKNFCCPKLGNGAQKKNKAPKRKSAENEDDKIKCKVTKNEDLPDASEVKLEIVDENVENEVKRENVEIEIQEMNMNECEEDFCGKSENVEEELEVTKSNNSSEDILSFLFEDNVKVSIKEKCSETYSSSCCDEKILSPLLFENNVEENCKIEVNSEENMFSRTSGSCSDEKLLTSILFQNSAENRKLEAKVKNNDMPVIYTKEKILSELFD